jgi:hypothetical protein
MEDVFRQISVIAMQTAMITTLAPQIRATTLLLQTLPALILT